MIVNSKLTLKPKKGFYHMYLSIITIDWVCNKNYYPQVFLEEHN